LCESFHHQKLLEHLFGQESVTQQTYQTFFKSC